MIGVIIPCYREHQGIAALIKEVTTVLIEPFLIIVVDDSPDQLTAEAVEGVRSPNVILIKRETKGGRGSAVIAGIKRGLEEGCRTLIEMDADFSHPPSEIPDILRESKTRGLDLLVSSRYLPTSQIINWPLTRHIFSACSNWLAHLVLQVPIHDYTNGYRCYSARAAERIAESCGRLGKGFIALSEILVNLYYAGYSVGERPTIFRNRVRGESSVNWREISGALIGLFRIYGLKRQLQAENEKLARINH